MSPYPQDLKFGRGQSVPKASAQPREVSVNNFNFEKTRFEFCNLGKIAANTNPGKHGVCISVASDTAAVLHCLVDV